MATADRPIGPSIEQEVGGGAAMATTRAELPPREPSVAIDAVEAEPDAAAGKGPQGAVLVVAALLATLTLSNVLDGLFVSSLAIRRR